jgi:hypothetical protein
MSSAMDFTYPKTGHPFGGTMQSTVNSMKDLNQEQKARLVADFFHRTVVHYGLWFAEVRHQLGLEKAIELLGGVFPRSSGIQVKRLGKTLGFEVLTA